MTNWDFLFVYNWHASVNLSLKLRSMFCLFFFKGQIFFTSTSFISGNLVFRLTPLPNSSSYDVIITRNNASDVWTRWLNTEYTVKDVLLYDSITINVRTLGSYVNHIVTYNGMVIFFYIHFLRYISQFNTRHIFVLLLHIKFRIF